MTMYPYARVFLCTNVDFALSDVDGRHELQWVLDDSLKKVQRIYRDDYFQVDGDDCLDRWIAMSPSSGGYHRRFECCGTNLPFISDSKIVLVSRAYRDAINERLDEEWIPF